MKNPLIGLINVEGFLLKCNIKTVSRLKLPSSNLLLTFGLAQSTYYKLDIN